MRSTGGSVTDRGAAVSRSLILRQGLAAVLLLALASALPLAALVEMEAGALAAEESAAQNTATGMMMGAFSFKLGEERCYRMGPEDSMRAGESADWVLRLDHFDDGAGVNGARDVRAIFAFEHERFEFLRQALNTQRRFLNVSVEGELTVNLDGFPLELEYVEKHSIAGEEMSRYGRRFVRFSFDGRRMEKQVRFDERNWDFKIGIASDKTVDLSIPRGLFTFVPSSVACLGDAYGGLCGENDPAFSNPGLLSLMMPALLEEEDGERDVMFFMPAGINVSPFQMIRIDLWVHRERDNINNLRRYFERTKMELGASVDIELGPRRFHAWEIEVSDGIKKVYIEPDGKVLRVDLESTMGNSRDRWIRLLLPSEL